MYHTSEGNILKAEAICAKPPATGRHRTAMQGLYDDVQDASPDVEVVQKHGAKGRGGATTCFVDCAMEGKDEFVAVLAVLWKDNGVIEVPNQVEVLEDAPNRLAEEAESLVLQRACMGAPSMRCEAGGTCCVDVTIQNFPLTRTLLCSLSALACSCTLLILFLLDGSWYSIFGRSPSRAG